MSESTIEIQIKGVAGQGKTTLAFAINNALRDLGLNVSLVDDNGVGSIDEHPGLIHSTLPSRIQALKEKQTPIKVQTIHQPRHQAKAQA